MKAPPVTRLPITKCEALPTEDLGPITEDGERYLVRVWNLVCMTSAGSRWVHHLADRQEKAAKMKAHIIQEHGSINPDKWAECVEPELPDYVTDPYNPIYN